MVVNTRLELRLEVNMHSLLDLLMYCERNSEASLFYVPTYQPN